MRMSMPTFAVTGAVVNGTGYRKIPVSPIAGQSRRMPRSRGDGRQERETCRSPMATRAISPCRRAARWTIDWAASERRCSSLRHRAASFELCHLRQPQQPPGADWTPRPGTAAVFPRRCGRTTRATVLSRVFAATSATSGTIGWDAAFERINASGLDIDADSFAAAKTITAVTVPGTSGQVLVSSVTFLNSEIDGLLAGEMYRLRIRRDVANDNAAGDAELLAVEVRFA